MGSMSSCYPHRLMALGQTTDGMHDGIVVRARRMGDAIERYAAGCRGEHFADCTAAANVVQHWANQVRELGRFAQRVGVAFQVVDGSVDDKQRFATPSEVNDGIPSRFRVYGDAPPAALASAPLPPVDLDGLLTDKPGRAAHIAVLLDNASLDVSITGLAHETLQVATRNGELPAFLTAGTDAAAEVDAFLEESGRTLTVASAFADEWVADGHDSDVVRSIRATGSGFSALAALEGGTALGTAVCSETGPPAALCGAIGGTIAGIAYAFGAEKLEHKLMDDLENFIAPKPDPPPNEHPVDKITKELRQPKLEKSLQRRVEGAARRTVEHDARIDAVKGHEPFQQSGGG